MPDSRVRRTRRVRHGMLSVLNALERGRYYAALYTPVDDDQGVGARDAARRDRDLRLIDDAIARLRT